MDNSGLAGHARRSVGAVSRVGCGVRLKHEHEDPKAKTPTDFCARRCPSLQPRNGVPSGGTCFARRSLRAFEWVRAYRDRMERTKQSATPDVWQAICAWEKELIDDIYTRYPIDRGDDR
jgi:hypothetical protein